MTSPRTRKLPRWKSTSLRSYWMSTSWRSKRVPTKLLAAGNLDDQAVVALGAADAVDAAHARHDDDLTPRQERDGRRVTHAIDLVVDDRVLVDERIGRRDVRLGLVVVVVADEVLDRVLREELAHLAVELGRERLVRREDQRRPARPLDDVRDRERLAGPGDAEENLVPIRAIEPFDQLLDGPGLIPLGLEACRQTESGRHRKGSLSPGPAAHSSRSPLFAVRERVRERRALPERPVRAVFFIFHALDQPPGRAARAEDDGV